MIDYLRDPDAIYARSFATIRAEADLRGLGEDMQDVAVRMIHATGLVEIAPHIRASEDVVEKIEFALVEKAPILCDAEAVKAAIMLRYLHGNELVVTLNDPAVPELAKRLKTTRSAAAVELWRDRLKDSIVLIGNAPTALFHLLEMLDDEFPSGWIAREEAHGHGIAADRGQRLPVLAGPIVQQGVRYLDHGASAIAHQRVGPDGAAMIQILQDFQALGDDIMRFSAFDVHHEADAARVVLVLGIIKSLSHYLMHSHNFPWRNRPAVRDARFRARDPFARWVDKWQ